MAINIREEIERNYLYKRHNCSVTSLLVILFCSLVVISFDMPAVSYTDNLADEPILYSNHRSYEYKLFTPERLLPLHEEISKSLASKVRFHVIPFSKWNAEEKRSFIAAEVLDIYYQEKTVSLDIIKQHTRSIIETILKNFSELTEDNVITVWIRLPEGKKISDINPELPEDCKILNTIRVGVRPTEYQLKRDSLFFLLCDGAMDLEDTLARKRSSLRPTRWRRTPDKK